MKIFVNPAYGLQFCDHLEMFNNHVTSFHKLTNPSKMLDNPIKSNHGFHVEWNTNVGKVVLTENQNIAI